MFSQIRTEEYARSMILFYSTWMRVTVEKSKRDFRVTLLLLFRREYGVSVLDCRRMDRASESERRRDIDVPRYQYLRLRLSLSWKMTERVLEEK